MILKYLNDITDLN